MTDGIQKGAGNAYALQAPPNLLSLYPDWQSFAQAWATGQVFTDLRLNPEGWNPLGTSLNKENLLKDATAALYGKTDTITPDEIFGILSKAAIISDGNLVDINGIETSLFMSGSYTGTATGEEMAAKKIITGFYPSAVFVANLDGDINRMISGNGGGGRYWSAFATRDFSASTKYTGRLILTISRDGFYVYQGRVSKSDGYETHVEEINLNAKAGKYGFIAFK